MALVMAFLGGDRADYLSSLGKKGMAWYDILIYWYYCFSLEIFMKGVHSILSQDFQIPSEEAKEASSVASAVVCCSKDPKKSEEIHVFSEELVRELKGCFYRGQSFRLRKEKMCGLYHELRTSSKFKDGWNKFLLNLIGEKAPPAFYQHVSHIVFRALIELEYPLSNTTSSQKPRINP